MNRRRCLSLVTGIALACLTLGATGANSQPARNDASLATKLTIWKYPIPGIDEVIAAFQAKNPDIDVETYVPAPPVESNYLAKLATGERPDVMWFQTDPASMRQLRATSIMRVLSDIPMLKPVFSSYRAASYSRSGQIDARHYALPLQPPTIFTSYYHRGVFAKYKLKVPTNLTQLLAMCRTIRQKASGVTPVYLHSADGGSQIPPFNMFLNEASNPTWLKGVVAGKIPLNSKPIVDGLRAMERMRDAKCFNPDTGTTKYDTFISRLVDGKTALVFGGDWILGSLRDRGMSNAQIGQLIGNAPVSLNKPAVGFANVASPYLPRTGDSAREAAAVKFLQFVAGDGYATYLKAGGTPSVFKGTATQTALSKAYLEALANGEKYGVQQIGTVLPCGFGDFGAMTAQIATGQSSATRIASQMNRAYRLFCKAAGIPGF